MILMKTRQGFIALVSVWVVCMAHEVRAQQGGTDQPSTWGEVLAQVNARQFDGCDDELDYYQRLYRQQHERVHNAGLATRKRRALSLGGVRGYPSALQGGPLLQLSTAKADEMHAFVKRALVRSLECGKEEQANVWFLRYDKMYMGYVKPGEEGDRKQEIIHNVLFQYVTKDQERLLQDLAGEQEQDRVVHRWAEAVWLKEQQRKERAREAAEERRARRASDRRVYLGLVFVGLYALLGVLLWYGSPIRLGLRRVKVPVHEHDEMLPYVHEELVRDRRVLEVRHMRKMVLTYVTNMLPVAIFLYVLAADQLSKAYMKPLLGKSYFQVMLAWLLSMGGTLFLTWWLWYLKSSSVPASVFRSAKNVNEHEQVLPYLRGLQQELWSIKLRERSWLSLSPERDQVLRLIRAMQAEVMGDNAEDVWRRHGPKLALFVLWKGLYVMGRHRRLPPEEYTEVLCGAYQRSGDEWGEAFERYWDALLTCPGGESQASTCESAWRHFWRLDEVFGEDHRVFYAERFDRAMIWGRKWSMERFKRVMLEGDRFEVSTGFVWCEDVGQERFWLDESRDMVSLDEEVLRVDEGSHVGVAHLSSVSLREYTRWGELFADYEVMVLGEQFDMRWPETCKYGEDGAVLRMSVAGGVQVLDSVEESWAWRQEMLWFCGLQISHRVIDLDVVEVVIGPRGNVCKIKDLSDELRGYMWSRATHMVRELNM